jgi:outer membrane protein assembly factor BamB
VYCFDAATGQESWNYDMKAHVWGSPLLADSKVYLGDEEGDLVIFAASKEKKILSKTMVDGREQDGPNFGAPLYSTPVAANGVLYIQTHTHLYAFQ